MNKQPGTQALFHGKKGPGKHKSNAHLLSLNEEHTHTNTQGQVRSSAAGLWGNRCFFAVERTEGYRLYKDQDFLRDNVEESFLSLIC